MRKETRNWLAQAREDREAAQVLFNSRKFFGVAFYSHQAVEKALKGAILEMTRSLPPKTHNLNELGRTLRVSEDIAEHLRCLNPEYTISRYPDAANGIPAENYSKKKAKAILRAADSVLEWVKRTLDT